MVVGDIWDRDGKVRKGGWQFHRWNALVIVGLEEAKTYTLVALILTTSNRSVESSVHFTNPIQSEVSDRNDSLDA